MNKKGFTLIELLVVIGILAVLATITVLVLNPAQLFAQARDSQRISDMGTLKGAISLYLTSVSGASIDLGSDAGGAFTCGTNYAASIDGTSTPFAGSSTDVPAKSGTFGIDGSGWVTVDLSATTGGSPVPAVPRDPVNDTTYFYAYACDNTNRTFELNANMESTRYAASGDNDVETTDGGDSNAGATAVYEVGTDPGLDL